MWHDDYSWKFSIIYLNIAKRVDLKCYTHTHTHTHTPMWGDRCINQLIVVIISQYISILNWVLYILNNVMLYTVICNNCISIKLKKRTCSLCSCHIKSVEEERKSPQNVYQGTHSHHANRSITNIFGEQPILVKWKDSILVQSTLTKYMVTEVQRYTELKVNKRSLVS